MRHKIFWFLHLRDLKHHIIVGIQTKLTHANYLVHIYVYICSIHPGVHNYSTWTNFPDGLFNSRYILPQACPLVSCQGHSCGSRKFTDHASIHDKRKKKEHYERRSMHSILLIVDNCNRNRWIGDTASKNNITEILVKF